MSAVVAIRMLNTAVCIFIREHLFGNISLLADEFAAQHQANNSSLLSAHLKEKNQLVFSPYSLSFLLNIFFSKLSFFFGSLAGEPMGVVLSSSFLTGDFVEVSFLGGLLS